MTLPEYYALGHRRCECANMTFTISKQEVRVSKRRHRDELKNLMANALLGTLEGKARITYCADCGECGKRYFCANSLKKLKADIKMTGIAIKLYLYF